MRPAKRRRKGLRVVDLMLLVAAGAVVVWAIDAPWTRPSLKTRMTFVVDSATRPKRGVEITSDELLGEVCRWLPAPRAFASPAELRKVLVVLNAYHDSYAIEARTGDPLLDEAVLRGLIDAYASWWRAHSDPAIPISVLKYGPLELQEPPAPFGEATNLAVFTITLSMFLVVFAIIVRALSWRTDAQGTTVETRNGAR